MPWGEQVEILAHTGISSFVLFSIVVNCYKTAKNLRIFVYYTLNIMMMPLSHVYHIVFIS
jgi:hypothetical protein